MKKFMPTVVLSLLVSLGFGLSLFNYVESTPMVGYQILGSNELDDGTRLTHILLQSQVWRGMLWEHDVLVVEPAEAEFTDRAVIFVTGDYKPDLDDTGDLSISDYLLISKKFSTPLVVLGDIPNQPIFGLREDDLIAHTFLQYIETHEEDLPILFPMVKSVVSTMDMIEKLMGIKKYAVTGASKRGWTTWLTAVVDERVFAIIPIVFDNLNFPQQFEHQIQMYGQYSQMLKPYTSRGLAEMISSKTGQELLNAVDPYSYKERLTMPKLIINATNDQYWTVDSAALYFNDLKGQNFILYVPNNNHGIKNIPYVLDNTSSFLKLVIAGKLPRVVWSSEESGITVSQSEGLKEVYMWRAMSDTTDFRKSIWVRIPQNPTGGFYHVDPEPPSGKHIAYYLELVLEIDGLTLNVCTPVKWK
ncbi:MAG: PhoPQ-activated pathogenicity-like protein PqaA type [Thermotogaceae bacterium]|nr:PhoPQ-activated pathogenicity-like protein PqaA type [Thermotogaceae bacterium]